MSPLWRLKYVCASTSGRISVLAAAVLLIGASEIHSPALAGRDKPPVAAKDLAVTEAGTEVRINVLANDFDPDGSRIRLKRVKNPSKGKIKKSKDGTIRYTPNESAEGKDSFRYVIKDRNGKGKKARGKVVVNILARPGPGGGSDNDPPVADAGANQNVTVGQSITLDGSSSFDPNNDPLTYSWALVSWPTGSTANFTNSTKKKPVFIADIAGTFVAELMVYDGLIRSAADQVEIVAAPNLPPPPPPGQAFSDLCADSSVIYCEGFEDLSRAEFNNRTAGHAIASDNQVYFEGGGALRLTVDGSREQEITGTIGYDFPQVTSGTFYVSMRMNFGDGLQSLIQGQNFGTGAGMKFFQLVAGPRSCSSEEIVLADSAINSYLTGLPQLVHSCSGYPFRASTDWQPVTGDLDNCGYTYINNQRAAGQPLDDPDCVLWSDDVWHLVELEVSIGSRLRLWIDGRLTVDATQTSYNTTPGGPYGRIYISNYMTGYGLWGHQMAGNGTFGNGLWRVRYDNLIISRNCVTGCGQ